MTKAVIIDQHGAGEYTIQVEDDTSFAQKQIDSLAGRLPKIEIDVLQASVAVLEASQTLQNTRTDLNQIIEDVLNEPEGRVEDPRIKSGVTELQLAANDLFEKQNIEANLKATRAALATQKTAYENSIAASTRSPFRCYCADYTEDLEIDAAVSMALVPGEDVGYIWTIRPGYKDQAEWTYETNGQLSPGWSMTPEAFYYNLAMLPGWQRWIPTYRFGLITEIYNDGTADVLLDDARSSQKNEFTLVRFNVNELLGQPTTLSRVPIEYMWCHWQAFSVDDHVVIEFEQQTSGALITIGWGDPTIIGFVERPKTCLHRHEIGMVDYHALVLGNSDTAGLIYPEAVRDLLTPYGGVPGEQVEVVPPLWLDLNGTVAGGFGTRFRVYSPYMQSLTINEDRTAPTKANRYLDGKDYKQMAATNKLRFAIGSCMGSDSVAFGWLDPYSKKPQIGQTFAIFTDIVYPADARPDLPAKVEYFLIYFANAQNIKFWKLEYDLKNPALVAARDEFLALGPPLISDTDQEKHERLRAESIFIGAIDVPDWLTIAPTPDYETDVQWLVQGNAFDYGMHVSWHGDRFSVVTREKQYNGLGNATHDIGRLYQGTIKRNRAADIDGRIEFDVIWSKDEEIDYTGQVTGDYIFHFDPQKDLHIYEPWAPAGDTGAWQTINEPRAPVYCFYDAADRFNIVRHYREFDNVTAYPRPDNWDRFEDEVFTCSPLSTGEGNKATGKLDWKVNQGFDDHGFFCERETEPGKGDAEEVWNHVQTTTTGEFSEVRSKTYNVWAEAQTTDVVNLSIVDQWWGDQTWSCDPDPQPWPSEPAGYQQTRTRGNGYSEAFNDRSVIYFRSYLILPAFDSSKIFHGFQADYTDTSTHFINFQNAALAVEDTPGTPEKPGSGRVMEWKVTGGLTNWNNGGGSGGETYLFDSPRWRVDGLMQLSGPQDEPIDTAILNVWLSDTGDSEPQTTRTLQPGEDPYEVMDEERGKWRMFDNARNTNLYLPIAFQTKFSANQAGYWVGDFDADDPDIAQARSDAGLPFTPHWDLLWMGSS